MANLIEKADYNGDGKFDGTDLDISWAYIQIKKLFEKEQADIAAGTMAESDATITDLNFVSKVSEMYETNKTAGIAEASQNSALSLPGTLSAGSPSPKKRINFKKLWLFNDLADYGHVKDSVSGEHAGQLNSAYYTNSTTIDSDNVWISKAGEVLLSDGGDIRSDRNWTFYAKGAVRTVVGASAAAIWSKGGFEVVFWIDPHAPKKVGVRVSSSGTKWIPGATSIHNYYDTPFAKSELENTELEMSIVREGVSIRLYINGQECVKKSGDHPDPIYGSDMQEPIKFKGSAWSRLDVCYLTELDFVNEDVLNVQNEYSGNINSFKFAHDMDIDNSYFAFKQYFPDKFGTFARIFGGVFGPAPEAQLHWTPPPSNFDITNGYVAKGKCLKLGTYNNNEYMTLPAVDFRKNFTISFWVSEASCYFNFFEMIGEDGTKITARFHFARTDTQSIKVKLGSDEKVFAMEGLSPGADAKWQHLTFVKNGNYFTLFGNGKHDGNTWLPWVLDSTTQNNLGSTSVKLQAIQKAFPVYLSHIRVLEYAVCPVPYKNIGRKSNYGIIPDLIEPIEPGNLGN